MPLNEARYYLGVTPEGEFDFFMPGGPPRYGPLSLMPTTLAAHAMHEQRP